MGNSYRIGVDGGGTKTELILVDQNGEIVTRHLAPGCNPHVAGPDQARTVLREALAKVHREPVEETRLYMAGAPSFWREFAAQLRDCGTVTTYPDSLPVLELATNGKPGLVLHGGTGSFVAARGSDGIVHYAGGLGWRFGDPGSGHDLGRRALTAGLLERQGWADATSMGRLVAVYGESVGISEPAELTRHFYQNPAPNRVICQFAPQILQLADAGDAVAHRTVVDSVTPLLHLAVHLAHRLFPGTPGDEIAAGLSGPILTHPAVAAILSARAPWPLGCVTDAPIVGVQRLLAPKWA